MRKRSTRILLFSLLVIGLAFLFNQYFIHIEGDGKETPEEALPTDQEYEWIEGPKSENEQRYFFLSNGNYFGTGIVTKNLTGWSSNDGVYAELPKPLIENEITAAYSDSQILYGLIKPNGQVHVTVNDKNAELIELNTLPNHVVKIYGVEGYSIWFIDLSILDNKQHFSIKLINSKNEIINELTI